MQAMDLFVFPSESEGLGLVLIEAQAAGLPCYTSEGCAAGSKGKRLADVHSSGRWPEDVGRTN